MWHAKSYKWILDQYTDIHTLPTIPLHVIRYNPTPEWPTCYQYTILSLTTTICIHNKVTPLRKHINPNCPLEYHTKHPHNHPSKQIHPPPPHNVKFSNTWKSTPNKDLPTQKYTKTPLPIYCDHTHPLNLTPNNAYTQMFLSSPPPIFWQDNWRKHRRIRNL